MVRDASGAHWCDDADFDIHRHVVRDKLVRTKGQSERAALQERVGVLASEPLDPRRPLWQFHLIDGYEGGSALIARVHHCIGDGIALISVMMAITDGGASRRGASAARKDADDGADWLADAVLKPLGGLSAKAAALAEASIARALEVLADPQQGLAGTIANARLGAKVMGDVAAMALMADDSPTLLKGKPSGDKRVAWGEPIALADVKAIGKALGGSINDVLLASVAGAIGAWLRDQGDDPAGKEIRAMVPVNLRPLEEAWQLGNRFGLAPLVLPIGIDNPVERVLAVRARMNELKSSYQPLLAFAVLAVAGQMVQPVQDAILGLFAKKATAVMTNVPGPAVPLKFCGSTLRQTMFWVPASGDIGVGVSILSYGGGVQFGLVTDEALCADPQAIIDRFEPEFEKLLLLTLMLPWAKARRRTRRPRSRRPEASRPAHRRCLARPGHPLDERVERRRSLRRRRVGDDHRHRVDAAALRAHVAGERARVGERSRLQVRLAGRGAALHAMDQGAVDAGDRQRIDERLRVGAAPRGAQQLDERARLAALGARLARAEDDGDVAVVQPLRAQPAAHALLRRLQRADLEAAGAGVVAAGRERQQHVARCLVVAGLVHLAQDLADRRQQLARPACRARPRAPRRRARRRGRAATPPASAQRSATIRGAAIGSAGALPSSGSRRSFGGGAT